MEKAKGLTKEQKSRAKDKMKEMATADLNVSPEEQKKLEEMMNIAKMPIQLTDKDIKLGEGEVDIRKLSDENYKQMIFRLFVLNNVYVRDLCSSLVDVMRLLMLSLKKQGYENITEAIDELMTDLQKQVKPQQKLN